MTTTEWVLLCSISSVVCILIGLFLGCLLGASKDEEISRDCTKCREAMQAMVKRLFFAGEGKE